MAFLLHSHIVESFTDIVVKFYNPKSSSNQHQQLILQLIRTGFTAYIVDMFVNPLSLFASHISLSQNCLPFPFQICYVVRLLIMLFFSTDAVFFFCSKFPHVFKNVSRFTLNWLCACYTTHINSRLII